MQGELLWGVSEIGLFDSLLSNRETETVQGLDHFDAKLSEKQLTSKTIAA